MFEQCLWCCEKEEEGGSGRGRSKKCGRKCHEDRSRARGQTDPKLRAWLAEWVTESWKQIWTLVSDSCRLTAKQLLIERKAEQRQHWLTTRRASRPHNRTTGPWRMIYESFTGLNVVRHDLWMKRIYGGIPLLLLFGLLVVFGPQKPLSRQCTNIAAGSNFTLNVRWAYSKFGWLMLSPNWLT